jgi:hypothetical protein
MSALQQLQQALIAGTACPRICPQILVTSSSDAVAKATIPAFDQSLAALLDLLGIGNKTMPG